MKYYKVEKKNYKICGITVFDKIDLSSFYRHRRMIKFIVEFWKFHWILVHIILLTIY